MKLLQTSFLFLFLVGISAPTQAQFWKKIQKKIEKKVEDKVNAKVDKTTDKIIDKALDGKKKEKKPTTTVTTKNTASNDVYIFNQAITIQVNNGTEDPVSFEFLFSKNNTEISCMKINESSMKGTEGMQGEMYLVSSKDKSTMYMNMMGMKIKKEASGNQLSQFDTSSKINDGDITATGKTKTVLGYSCKEYLAKSEDITVQIWATDQGFPIKGVFVPMLGMRNNNNIVKGFVLEMNVNSKQGNQSIKVTNISNNTNVTINTRDYKSMGF